MNLTDFIYNCVIWIFWLYILPLIIITIWNETTGDEWETDNLFTNFLISGAIIFVIIMSIYEIILKIFKKKIKYEK